MKIPKYINKDNKKYQFVKIYPNFILYEDIETKTKECFSRYELGYRTKQIKDRELHIGYHL